MLVSVATVEGAVEGAASTGTAALAKLVSISGRLMLNPFISIF